MYSIKEKPNTSLKFGINDGFKLKSFGWNDQDGRAEIEFETPALKFPLRVMLYEPNKAFENNSIEQQQAKQSQYITAIMKAFVDIDKVSQQLGEVSSLKQYIEKLASFIPAEAYEKELEVILGYNNRGYLEIKRTLGGIDVGPIRVKDSDQPELQYSDWFESRYGKKPNLPESTVTTDNTADSKWGV